MKLKIVLLAFILLGSTFLFGSGKDSLNPIKKCRLGLVLYGMGSKSSFFTPTVPLGMTLNFNIKKHAFYIGTNFLAIGKFDTTFLDKNPNRLFYHDIYNDHLVSSFGIMAGYQRYLFPRSNRLNVYLEYTFNSFTAKVGVNGSGQRIYTDYVFTNTLGYGLKFRLFKKVYLYQSLGLGYHLAIFEYPKDAHLSSEGDYILTAKFGLGYDF